MWEGKTRKTSIFPKVFDAESMSSFASFLLDNQQLVAEITTLFTMFSLFFCFALNYKTKITRGDTHMTSTLMRVEVGGWRKGKMTYYWT